MARIKIALPEKFPFHTDVRIRVTDVNYAGHLGNDSVLSIVHEARDRWLRSMGYTELNVEGTSIIMNDAAIVYKSEGYPGETLVVAVTAGDVHRKGCDVLYRLTCKEDGREVARAKTGIVFYDFSEKRMVMVPEGFLKAIGD